MSRGQLIGLAHDGDMLKALAAIQPGAYNVNVRRPWWRFWVPRERGGWITVSRGDCGGTQIMWTTGRDAHWPLGDYGPALCVTIAPGGQLKCYMESALSMLVMWGHGRGGEEELRKAMEFAAWVHSRLCSDQSAS